MGANYGIYSIYPHKGFQSTHPRWVRMQVLIACLQCSSFNPRTRDGCEAEWLLARALMAAFQSTHPRWVRNHRCSVFTIDDLFQSTHPRWVRKHNSYKPNANAVVSIHAPAMGAKWLPHTNRLARGFNPRTRDGCERPAHSLGLHSGLFQSTHPRWVRNILVNACHGASVFQSTHPRWVRTAVSTSCDSSACFNPRTRDGCEHDTHAVMDCLLVSIHAPAMGAKVLTVMTRLMATFQSTHPRWVRKRAPCKMR